jgi:hypothetical protein
MGVWSALSSHSMNLCSTVPGATPKAQVRPQLPDTAANPVE